MSCEIVLAKGRGVAVVDDADAPLVTRYRWHLHTEGYAEGAIPTGRRGARSVLMHRLIMGVPIGVQVDHRDGNRLNNQRGNLRVCGNAQNAKNRRGVANRTSRFKGVHFDQQTGKWRALIMVNRRTVSCGRHRSEEDAARAYDEAAKRLHGEFARLNFPEPCEVS